MINDVVSVKMNSGESVVSVSRFVLGGHLMKLNNKWLLKGEG